MKLKVGQVFSLWLTNPETKERYWCGPKKVMSNAFMNNPKERGGCMCIKLKDLRPGGGTAMWAYSCVSKGARELTQMEIALYVGKKDVT